MNNSKYLFRFTALMLIALFFTVSSFAQRGGGRQHRGNGYNNNRHYNSSRHYNSYPRARVSINFGRPSYGYRPHYRPIYRSPYAYSHFGPTFGFRLNILPVGYSRVYVGSSPYYYNQGVYYRSYSNGGYEVVAPPLGATVSQLPPGATVTVIDGQKYYQQGGTFYQEEISENNLLSYRVVGTDGVINTIDNEELPAVGSRYDQLPETCTVEVINQHKYFISTSGVYYQEVIEGNKVRYEVTTVAGD